MWSFGVKKLNEKSQKKRRLNTKLECHMTGFHTFPYKFSTFIYIYIYICMYVCMYVCNDWF